MGQLLSLLWDLCRLRRGPQDLPYSPQLLLIACALHLGLRLVVARVLGAEDEGLGTGILSLAFNLGALYLLLSLRGLSARFMQTALALICCAIIFSILSMITLMFGAVALVILTWKLIVDGHILRHSLNVPFSAGIIIAVLWLIAELALGAVAT